jgi:hypothetical protein
MSQEDEQPAGFLLLQDIPAEAFKPYMYFGFCKTLRGCFKFFPHSFNRKCVG